MIERSNLKTFLIIVLSIVVTTILIASSSVLDKLSVSQLISSIGSGILIGSIFFFWNWHTNRDLFFAPIENNGSTYSEPEKPKFISFRHRGDLKRSIFSGIIFYVLSYIGAGILFGYDFGTKNFTGTVDDLFRSSLIIIFLLGMMFELFMQYGIWIEVILLLPVRFRYTIAGFISLGGIIGAIVVSTIFFDSNPFLTIAITSRIVFGHMMRIAKPNKQMWKATLIIVVITSTILLATIAYVFGGRIA